MRILYRTVGLAAAVALSSLARAGELPLYQPAPSWVVPVALPEGTAKDGPPIVVYDVQQRIERGRLWSYMDGATRIASPEMLAQLNTITLPWAPDKGDLIVHELTILRDGKRIDLLAQGQKFTVLRREQSLEQRELTGILTASLAIEGLQVGDILRLRQSTTSRDEVLSGRTQTVAPLVAAPAPVALASARFSWPTTEHVRWKLLADGVTAKPITKGGVTELAIALPVIKQPDMPADAPMRYRQPPLVELSTFDGWADVSKVMAPLYATANAITPGSPLAGEVAAIAKAETTPLARAQRALELVQDKVRYLAIGMDGGNYRPQTPSRTWELRYGDCKAKTLLLLAMLHALNIEAEAVLAHVGLGDLVPERLPAATAFNHILVRATIGGETLWLDGTGSGSRLADIHDTPPFGQVLPVRLGGAELMPIAMRPNARPVIDLSVSADESASSDLPTVFDAKAVVRGGWAAQLTLARAQLGPKEQREAVAGFLQGWVGQGQYTNTAIMPDPKAGSVTLSARGVTTTLWSNDDHRRKRTLARTLDGIEFAPDRNRPAWTAVPVVAQSPGGTRWHLRVRLPDGGTGHSIEGQPDLTAHLVGYDVTRHVTLAAGVVDSIETVEALGREIPAADIPGERDRLTTAKAAAPRVVAPPTTRRSWDLAVTDPVGATQMKAIEAVFAQSVVDNPDETDPYTSRASYRVGVGDRKGAYADLTRAIAISPSVDIYLRRSALSYDLGDLSSAVRDAEAARKLDPASAEAIGRVAGLMAEAGNVAGGVQLLDERIALGGDTRTQYREAKASLIGTFGDPLDAIKQYDALLTEKPGLPSLLNGRCWVKATRAVMLDTALKDCTAAIELSSSTYAALDSRAMVWYRLGRFEDALRDIDAVLAEEPGLPASRFMRAVVMTRLHRASEADHDLTIARRRSPSVDRTYGRYGIKP